MPKSSYIAKVGITLAVIACCAIAAGAGYFYGIKNGIGYGYQMCIADVNRQFGGQ